MSNASDDAMMEQWKAQAAEAEALAVGPVPLELARELQRGHQRLMTTFFSAFRVVPRDNGEHLTVEESAQRLKSISEAEKWKRVAQAAGAPSLAAMFLPLIERGMHLARVNDAMVRLAEEREGVAKQTPSTPVQEIKIDFSATPAFPLDPHAK